VCFQHNTHYTEHCQARKPPCRYFTSRLFASLRFSATYDDCGRSLTSLRALPSPSPPPFRERKGGVVTGV
jgi:hypothetical protein